jgi:coenzyme F420-reducing hydrogenase delta subunit/Pyruvate/2-oxoacid:ferredoxin oxidoreductase delta subunit
MPLALVRPVESASRRVLAVADAAANRLYGWMFNPLYQSGALVAALSLVVLVTGLWLTLFYRVGSPWESVARITADPWLGNWVRGLHRYASDLAVIATAIHAWRMFAQRRTWGARTMAWVTGAVLLLLLFICGWTGYVMVWDTFGQQLAREGARMIDALPFLSEPTGRAFTGEQPVPTVFFFINLFAHIGVPLVMGVVFWLHVKRLPRPTMLPPRPLLWATVGLLTAVAVVWPLEMAPRADAFVLPDQVPSDILFAFWMPVSRGLGGGAALLLAVAFGVALASVPLLTARRGTAAPLASTVDEELCSGCTQCAVDCPYGAITMVARGGSRPALAEVDPDLCVSCGICAASCAPMGVGPPGRTGRDQLVVARAFLASPARRPGEVVVVGCTQAVGPAATYTAAALYAVSCAGNVHTSVIELLLRGGSGGVLVLTCPPRDCWNREGPQWLAERVHLGREAELQARVDRARVRIAEVSVAEPARARRIVADFVADIAALSARGMDPMAEGDAECRVPRVAERTRA